MCWTNRPQSARLFAVTEQFQNLHLPVVLMYTMFGTVSKQKLIEFTPTVSRFERPWPSLDPDTRSRLALVTSIEFVSKTKTTDDLVKFKFMFRVPLGKMYIYGSWYW